MCEGSRRGRKAGAESRDILGGRCEDLELQVIWSGPKLKFLFSMMKGFAGRLAGRGSINLYPGLLEALSFTYKHLPD